MRIRNPKRKDGEKTKAVVAAAASSHSSLADSPRSWRTVCMETMVCCFSCQTLLTSSFVPMGVQAETWATVSGFTGGCCPLKCLCYWNVLLSKSSSPGTSLLTAKRKQSDQDQSLPKDLLLKGQPDSGTLSGQLAFWHSSVITSSPANLWLFQLADRYPVLLLEDNGTLSSLHAAVHPETV